MSAASITHHHGISRHPGLAGNDLLRDLLFAFLIVAVIGASIIATVNTMRIIYYWAIIQVERDLLSVYPWP